MFENIEEKMAELFDKLVPTVGPANTLAGEIVRAANRLGYRFNNDGDHINVGYGKETCNAAARYLIENTNNDIADELIELFENSDYYEDDDNKYGKSLESVLSKIVNYVESNPKLLTTSNSDDYLNYDDDEDYYSEDDEESDPYSDGYSYEDNNDYSDSEDEESDSYSDESSYEDDNNYSGSEDDIPEKYSLLGVDGNAFNIMGYVVNALKREGLKDLVDEYYDEAMSSNYDHVISTSMDYLDRANKAACGC